jgi:Response regulators consisting of a CheY-like receiver domain and a winged-helix DNA-binding domain
MEASPLQTLPLTYRQAETNRIIRLLRAGESASIIGVSGMAKSNLFRHLLNQDVRRHYLDNDCQDYLFVAADANALGELSERAAYDLLLEKLIAEAQQHQALEQLAVKLDKRYQQVMRSTDALYWQKVFAQSLRSLLNADPRLHAVFLFDQFDDLCRGLNPKFFANLRAIRDEHKYRVSYITFTRDELPALCQAAEFEEFYELFSPNVMGLGPYRHDEALVLLRRVSGRYQQSLSDEACERLIELTRGHPGLLKALCLATLHGKVSSSEIHEQAITRLLEIEDVHNECAKLWNSISRDEQDALHRLASGAATPLRNPDLDRRLRLKNLVINQDGGLVPFCAIFARYAVRQKAERATETRMQVGPIRIDVAGEVWVDGRQVIPPLSKKELSLLKYLCMNPRRLVTKDEVFAIVYPDEYQLGGAVSDEALNRLVQRMREKIKEFSSAGEYVITVRGKGYRLDVS